MSDWRSMMTIDLTDFFDKDALQVYGPWRMGDLGKFPLRAYVVEKIGLGHAAFCYTHEPYELQRPEQGVQVGVEMETPDDAYGIAYGIAKEFASRQAQLFGVRFKEDVRRKPT